MMVFLDTSCLLPSIRLLPEGVDSSYLETWLTSEEKLLYSSISLFELSAKGAKSVQKGILDVEDVTHGIEALRGEIRLSQVPFWDPDIQEVAIRLRRFHSDYIDCLIVASAALRATHLITEDRRIHDFASSEEWTIEQEKIPRESLKVCRTVELTPPKPDRNQK